jgi:hypothetical protein
MMFLRLSDAGAGLGRLPCYDSDIVADLNHFNEGQGNHPD